MPIPSTKKIKRPLLKRLQQVNQVRISELYDYLSKHFQLTSDELKKKYESGNDYIFKNRVRWARKQLIIEGLAVSPGYGLLEITQKGRKSLLNDGNQIPEIDN